MKLLEYMRKYKITQINMAKKLGISSTYLRMLIRGTHFPSRKLARIIEKITSGEVSKEEVIFNDEEENKYVWRI